MSEHENGLKNAQSAYLRSAIHQPVNWHEWGADAFAIAKREGKPVLLDIGAVWCHWCHVMDRESYENAEIAEIINQHFVAVKVDRDERPDVDSRYQAAVQAISGQGGWPLTAFLTSDGRPFFGGTYFPPDDRYGRAGFRRVLVKLAQAFREKPDDIEESASGVMAAISRGESLEGHGGEVSERIIESIVDSARKQFDPVHGGFGTQPKFPHPSAIELLILQYLRTRDVGIGEVVQRTLEEMANGGIHDQVGGGFHRYSVDDKWIVPHFEKMAYDNALLLRNYVWAAKTFNRDKFKQVAIDTAKWLREVLSDRDGAGFYSSQDADINLEDDGDYFTWTVDEAKEALAAGDVEFARTWFDIEPVGEMHHDPHRNVLWVTASDEQLATRFGLSRAELELKKESVREQLAAARAQRPTPFIDRAKYVNWNALCVSGFIALARAYGDADAQEFALRSLEYVWTEAWEKSTGLRHVIGGAHVPGMLDDYADLLAAFLDAYGLTSNAEHLLRGKLLADRMIEDFFDKVNGGFFDIARHAGESIGALTAWRKPVQDSPTPAGNSVAAHALLRLYALTEREEYRRAAEDTLRCFAGAIEHFGYFASAYGTALRELLSPATKVVVIGRGSGAQEMWEFLRQNWAAERTDLCAGVVSDLPDVLRELIQTVAAGGDGAVVCSGFTCLPLARDKSELQKRLHSLSMA